MPHLFTPLKIRDIQLKNRIAVSPMCMYSSENGVPNDWHMVHLGSRAVGGAALVVTEATAVEAAGRISATDAGLYEECHTEAWRPIAEFISNQGSVPGIQLAHAGRKASTNQPWNGGRLLSPDEGGWRPVWSASDIAFSERMARPEALDEEGLERVRTAFRIATRRSLQAGFRWIEIHAAHGYLLHQFLSPLSNVRADSYGGSLQNRMRYPLEIAAIVREEFPQELPVTIRISATDWAEEGGWTLDDSVVFASELKRLGIDLIDCSSGGTLPHPKIPLEVGYQVPFAKRIREETGILTGAVGLITEPAYANEVIASGAADLVYLARQELRDPYFPYRAAKALGVEIDPPNQYARAW